MLGQCCWAKFENVTVHVWPGSLRNNVAPGRAHVFDFQQSTCREKRARHATPNMLRPISELWRSFGRGLKRFFRGRNYETSKVSFSF